MKKKTVLTIILAVMAVIPQGINAQSVQFNGAWEIQTNHGVFVINFIDNTFAIFTRDGGYVLDGIYSIGTDSWGILRNTRNPQHTRNLFLQFDVGMGLDAIGFTYEISSNELRLSSDGINNTNFFTIPVGNNRVPAHSLLSGSYRRSNFNEPTGSPPIGFWKLEDDFGNVQIFRFFGEYGSMYTFIVNEGNFVAPFRYERGRFTFLHDEQTFSYYVSGNVLTIDWGNGTNEYRRR